MGFFSLFKRKEEARPKTVIIQEVASDSPKIERQSENALVEIKRTPVRVKNKDIEGDIKTLEYLQSAQGRSKIGLKLALLLQKGGRYKESIEEAEKYIDYLLSGGSTPKGPAILELQYLNIGEAYDKMRLMAQREGLIGDAIEYGVEASIRKPSFGEKEKYVSSMLLPLYAKKREVIPDEVLVKINNSVLTKKELAQRKEGYKIRWEKVKNRKKHHPFIRIVVSEGCALHKELRGLIIKIEGDTYSTIISKLGCNALCRCRIEQLTGLQAQNN